MGTAPSVPRKDAAEIERLTAALAASEAARAADRAAAAADRAAAAADRADAALARKVAFVRWLDSIAASGSETSPADVARRGAPLPVTAAEDDVLRDIPPPSLREVRTAWALYTDTHAPAAASDRTFELLAVQPVLARLARAAAGGTACAMRMWYGDVAADDVVKAAMAPDQVWTHARDASSTAIGALVIVEVKRPTGIIIAVAQAAKYLRRRVAALFHEADSRGETGHDIFALAVATDGNHVVLLRMASGARADGEFPLNLQPCPVLATAALPLLAGWDFVDTAWGLPPTPPAGFAALVRLLRAPLATLGGGLPLDTFDATLEPDGVRATLDFDARLGSGGTSDVYSLRAAAGARFAGAVAKIPRFATHYVDDQYRREAFVLRALTDDGADVPAVVFEGSRDGVAPSHIDSCRWPVLLLAPAGEPLCSFVGRLVDREQAAFPGGGSVASRNAACKQRIAAVRLALANRVASSVLRVLQLAHARDFIHCDVRPANIVVVGGDGARFLLIDWGICVDAGTDVVSRGVPAFAPAALFEQRSYDARAALDLVALAHTWLAVAYGSRDASAPWVTKPDESIADTLARRVEWLHEHAREAAAVAPLLGAGVGRLRDDVYAWGRDGGSD